MKTKIEIINEHIELWEERLNKEGKFKSEYIKGSIAGRIAGYKAVLRIIEDENIRW